MGRKVYCQVDEHNNVIDCVRGDGIVFDGVEQWHDVTDVEGSETLTEVYTQKRVKVLPKVRRADGSKKAAQMAIKPDFRFVVNKRKIQANGNDAATLKIESIDDVEYLHSVKIQVNGKTTSIMVGEELMITSDVNQRIGVKGIDPDVGVIPKVVFIQATGRGDKDETHPSKRKG